MTSDIYFGYPARCWTSCLVIRYLLFSVLCAFIGSFLALHCTWEAGGAGGISLVCERLNILMLGLFFISLRFREKPIPNIFIQIQKACLSAGWISSSCSFCQASLKILKVEEKLSKGWGGENAYHVSGYRYLLVDGDRNVSRASPPGKVTTLTKVKYPSIVYFGHGMPAWSCALQGKSYLFENVIA